MTVTIVDLAQSVNYDPETGVFTWKEHQPRARAGSVAGHINSRGYWRILFKKRGFNAHRLAWFIHTGRLPIGEIDHKNLIKTDNRIANLRECSRAQNAANRRATGRGLKGTRKLPSGNYQANLWHNGIAFNLGVFKTELQAHEAYVAKALEVYGEFARAA
jgi:hypothetical protein